MIRSLDHLVLTVADIERTVDFYCGILGMQRVAFGAGRVALAFGAQKINLHQQGREFEPKAAVPMPGSADLCFVVGLPLSQVVAQLTDAGVALEEGPVARTGAMGPITSVYVRDPDGNLIELSQY
ncbi:MAG: VOC family protein [Magnetospirillum sp.]|nr:VOC family protein [Magnetospirillum sp.]